MCGIVGYIGHQDATSFVVHGLRRLEYRGYDSAGVATVCSKSLQVRKAAGRLSSLEALIAAHRPRGNVAIGHTRWATHGRPSDTNAHPHLDCRGTLAIVHNGIIENYRELRKSLASEGHRFRSQTDTEVIAHLLEKYRAGGLIEAARRTASDLRGTYAVACIAADAPDELLVLRRGSSPLIVG